MKANLWYLNDDTNRSLDFSNEKNINSVTTVIY